MTDPSGGPIAPTSVDRSLARLHLKVGSTALARAELEALASRDALDGDSLVDLAEVRWRMGDTALADEAAQAAIDAGSASPLALIIAAEAASGRGRPGDARRLADRAMVIASGTLDGLFAGMPRSAVWPADPAGPPMATATLFGDEPPSADGIGAGDQPADATGTDVAPIDETPVVPHDPDGPGLWDDPAGEPLHPPPLDAARLMAAGLAALDGNEPDRAALWLALAIRTGPHLAPAILDRTIDATQAPLLLVRGDAFSAVGDPAAAAEAFRAASRDLGGSEPIPVEDIGPTPDAALQSGPIEPHPQ